MQRRKRKTLKRFAISFLGVLVLPVIFFIYLFMNDFREIYQSKVTEQAESTLKKTVDELDRQIETLYDIVTYNSRLDHFQAYSVANDITGKGIISALNAEEAVHSIIDKVHYYNPVKPERVYTSLGTYTLEFYAELVAGFENKEQLLAEWNSMDGDGWIYTKKAFSNGRETTVLQYVIKTKMQERWIFTFSNDVLEQMLGEERVVTALLDKVGNQLFVSDQRTDVEKNGYEIFAKSQNEHFQLVRFGSEMDLLSEVRSVQERFWKAVAIVLIIGFFLVSALTIYNEYPIRKIQKYCIEKVKHVPMNLGGMDVLLFSFKDIEKKVALLEQRQIREKLLLQLLLDKNCGSEEFRKKLSEAGIFAHVSCYRVIIVVLQKEENGPKLELCIEQETLGKNEIYLLDILASNAIVMVAGVVLQGEKQFEETLQGVAAKMRDMLNDEVQFFVGSSESLEGVSNSYKQAMMAWQGSIEPIDWEKENLLRYPSDELRLLYDALVEIDYEKAGMITDVLIEILKLNSDNRFLCASLYYDIFNAYYNACSKLEAEGSTRPLDMELLDVQDVQTMIEMVMNIKEQFALFIEEPKVDETKKKIISKVTDYIDANITDYELSVSMLADYFNISISNLSHQFKAQKNCTISGYITEKRFAYAGKLLLETDYTVNVIAELLGYSQARSFIRKFRQYYGMTPIEYRNKYGDSL